VSECGVSESLHTAHSLTHSLTLTHSLFARFVTFYASMHFNAETLTLATASADELHLRIRAPRRHDHDEVHRMGMGCSVERVGARRK